MLTLHTKMQLTIRTADYWQSFWVGLLSDCHLKHRFQSMKILKKFTLTKVTVQFLLVFPLFALIFFSTGPWCFDTDRPVLCSLSSSSSLQIICLLPHSISLPPSHFMVSHWWLRATSPPLWGSLATHCIKLTGCIKLLQPKPSGQAPGRPGASPQRSNDHTLRLIRWDANKDGADRGGEREIKANKTQLKIQIFVINLLME